MDDEKIIADSLGLILRGRGFTVRVAYGGKQAIADAGDFAPDVLISDVVMPDMNGVALADHFFHQCPACRVILMSGNATSRALLALAAERGHHYAFIPKPFHPTKLLEILDRFQSEE